VRDTWCALQTLDLSWNSLGHTTFGTAAGVEVAQRVSQSGLIDVLCHMFRQNTTLAHLDLRHNNFRPDAVPLLAHALESNHTLRGIHCDGNPMRCDARGFLVPVQNGFLEDADGSGDTLLGGRIVFRDARREARVKEASGQGSGGADADDDADPDADRVRHRTPRRLRRPSYLAQPHDTVYNGLPWLPHELNRDNCWLCGAWKPVRLCASRGTGP